MVVHQPAIQVTDARQERRAQLAPRFAGAQQGATVCVLASDPAEGPGEPCLPDPVFLALVAALAMGWR